MGVGCWEQLRNEPRTSTNILCALELALEPPSAHPSSWHPLGPWPSSWGPGAARGRPKTDCQRGRDTAAGSSAGLLSVCEGQSQGGGAYSPPNPICLDPVSEARRLERGGWVCAPCWGARLHARVGYAAVNRCAALCKPGLGLVTHPRSVSSFLESCLLCSPPSLPLFFPSS